MNMTTTDRPVAELLKSGFKVRPWEAAAIIEEITGKPYRDTRIYEMGSVHGLVEITSDALNVIAIHNNTPGNGWFKRAVNQLEKTADRLNVKLRIVQFWNVRLCGWFIKRGYCAGKNSDWGLYAERAIPCPPSRPTTD